ncbi:MAG: lipid biosynthesis B12-binding/radical SAM protein [Phycisphaerae bacterium]
MANVLLISCNFAREPYPVYPLGMTLVAEAARARGHTVREWDPLHAVGSHEKIVDAASTCATMWEAMARESFNPDVIGISLRNIDNCDSSCPIAYADRELDAPVRPGAGFTAAQLVEALRAHTDRPIVLGGAGFSLFPDSLVDRVGADYGVVGEGEGAFCELVELLESGDRPAERVIHSSRVIPPEQFSCNSRDPALASFYLRDGGMLNVQTKRGCPHRCAYCTYPVLEGRTYRFSPVEAVVDEIESLIKRYGANYYAMADSVFNDRHGRYLGIAEELVRRSVDVPWMAFFRPQQFDREEIALLRRSGLHSVEWGTDCASDTTLAHMGKDFTWDQAERSNSLFAEAGINNAHFVIFGGPGETEQTLEQGIANIGRLADCVVFAYCGVRILPGTGVHRLALAQGLAPADDDLLNPRFYFSPELSRQRVHEALLEAFAGRPDRIYPPQQDAERLNVFHRMGHRGPIWDMLLRRRTRTSRRRRADRAV